MILYFSDEVVETGVLQITKFEFDTSLEAVQLVLGCLREHYQRLRIRFCFPDVPKSAVRYGHSLWQKRCELTNPFGRLLDYFRETGHRGVLIIGD